MAPLHLIRWVLEYGIRNPVGIDNKAFQLNYRLSFPLLVMMSLFSVAFHRLPECTFLMPPGSQETMNVYCWVHGTYRISGVGAEEGRNLEIPSANSDWSYVSEVVTADADRSEHYFWIPAILIIQGIFFYLPHYIWKCIEGGKMRTLSYLFDRSPWMDQSQKNARKMLFITQFVMMRGNNGKYANGLLLSEILNLINAVGQFTFLNWYLGAAFSTYGIQGVLDWLGIHLYRTETFPTVAGCLYREYGIGGNIINYEGVCVLLNNSLNQKIFAFLWFWLILMTVVNFAALVNRVICICISTARQHLLQNECLLETDREMVRTLVNSITYADWLVLYQFSGTMNHAMFHEVVSDLGKLFVPKIHVA